MSKDEDTSFQSFLNSFTKPKMYVGSGTFTLLGKIKGNAYVVIGTAQGCELAMQVELAQAKVPVHGIHTDAVGFGIRLIEITDDEKSGGVFQHMGPRHEKATFNAEDNTQHSGLRRLKTFLPVMSFPCAPEAFRQYVEKTAVPQLLGWLKDGLAAAGGGLSMSEDELAEALLHAVQKVAYVDETKELFHLPGVKPVWLEEKKVKPGPSPFEGGEPPEDEEEDPEGDD